MGATLAPDLVSGFTQVVGIGGIGSGIAFQLEGDHTLGREESRLGALLPGRDYCKLHIVEHYLARLMGAGQRATKFRVSAIGVVGEDATGRRLIDEMDAAGIDTAWVRLNPNFPTLFSACFVYPNRMGGNITANNSAAATITEADIQQAGQALAHAGAHGIALCLPEVPLGIRRSFLKMATEYGSFRAASFTLSEIAQAHRLELFPMIDLLALNIEEASALVGYACVPGETEQFLTRCSDVLTSFHPAIRIVISAGADGAYGFADGRWVHCAAPLVQVVSTGGAGDALLAGVLCGLAAGCPMTRSADTQRESALELGVLLATFSVTSADTIHFGVSLDSLRNFARAHGVSLCGSTP